MTVNTFLVVMDYGLLVIECGISCHKRCQSKLPNLCGVNEKLLAEALRNVKEEKKIRNRLEVCTCVIVYM